MNKINHSINILHDYCEKEDYRGWDPFDGLNSELFNKSNLKILSASDLNDAAKKIVEAIK